MKTLEDYIREYDLEQVQGYYVFKNPCHYPVIGRLFACSKIEPHNVYAAADIFATDHSIEYFGWDKLYPEDYEEYFSKMLSEYNVAIALYKALKVEKKLSNLEKDF